MAAAGTPRPGRMLGIVAIVVAALYLGLFLGPSATPKLGLDLRGGTQVILTATPLSGGKVTKGALNQAVGIIRNRVDAAGVGGASINTQGSTNIVVSAPGVSRSRLAALDQTALLRFRQVLAVGSGAPAPAASQSATPTPSGSATAKKSPAPKQKKKRSTRHDALTPALVKASSTPTPAPSPSASASPSPSASASPGAAASNDKVVPGSMSKDLSTVQQTFATYDCSQNTRPTAGVDPAEDYIVSCSTDGVTKFLLAPAGVEGSEIKSADATVDTQTNEWLVQLNFNHQGATDWYNLTKKAFETNAEVPSCSPPKGCNAIGIVLDGVVQSYPRSQQDGIAGGQTQITGSFTQDEAKTLANVLKFGALPLRLEKASVSSISASLGSDQLRGGLIAGAIGLGLVILYSLFYYRALGLVTIASLALSGLILYAVTTLLGHSSLGYTLSLPGIAGFIVAVGITADSFVVFFERLRDEVREGRRLRSGIERAWPRARRTIISADAVSLLAAVVLYIVSIGDVRGFAFTLGLSTLSDLFIVFFFTRPLMTLMARLPAFDRGATWTGVGRARAGAALEPRGV
ncbi:MAG TPA: protein translocase subunit SecD [Mycobacteriales bacterium]|nr:protein translocase subunit SecD [Mycobacteriales bacterium]